MEDMKMIDDLFDKAREEKPRLSFEAASQAFFTSALAVGGLMAIKQLIINKIGLNTIIMISTTSIISTALIVSSLSTESPKPEALNTGALITDSISIQHIEAKTLIKEKTIEIDQRQIPLFEERFDTNMELKPLVENSLAATFPKSVDDQVIPSTVASSHANLIIIEHEDLTPANISTKASAPKCTKSFCIKNNDDMKELECIVKCLEKLDLEIEMDPEFNRDDELEMLKLRIQHENGLDLKLKVAGFTTFALMCIQDENGEVIALKYKTDEHEYSEVNMFSKTSYTYMKSAD